MPTADQLALSGHLKIWPTKTALGKEVKRKIYIGESAGRWINENLKELQPDGFYDGALRPREQLVDVFRRFMIGEPINDLPPKTLRPHKDGIHELRSHDLRVFGWFWRQAAFIAGSAASAKDLKDNSVTYFQCMEVCMTLRGRLDLDDPKFITGDIDDILRF